MLRVGSLLRLQGREVGSAGPCEPCGHLGGVVYPLINTVTYERAAVRVRDGHT